MMRDIFLRSGKWRWTIADQGNGHRQTLELFQPAAPYNKMSATLPLTAQEPSNEEIERYAREPEVRLWTDSHGILWRIARVGPGTHYPYPLDDPYLVFDSEQAFAGIVPIDASARLGDLTGQELQMYRDRMRDFGGRRRAFRPPFRQSA